MRCDTCRQSKDCVALCEDMENFLPKEMRFEEVPFGGASEMENIIQRYIEESAAPVIQREISPDLFKIGIELLNKLTLKQHIILYLYHVAGVNDRKIAHFFKTHRGNIQQRRKFAYEKIRRMQNDERTTVEAGRRTTMAGKTSAV